MYELEFFLIIFPSFTILYLWLSTYNSFQYLLQSAHESFSNIDILTQQRLDMISTIIETAKHYNIHENKTFDETAQARSTYEKSTTLNDRIKSIDALEKSFIKVKAVVESYPTLKAVLLASNIQKHGVAIENNIAFHRMSFNKIVKSYNYKVYAFPTSIVATIHHFLPIEYLSFTSQPLYIPSKIYSTE